MMQLANANVLHYVYFAIYIMHYAVCNINNFNHIQTDRLTYKITNAADITIFCIPPPLVPTAKPSNLVITSASSLLLLELSS